MYVIDSLPNAKFELSTTSGSS